MLSRRSRKTIAVLGAVVVAGCAVKLAVETVARRLVATRLDRAIARLRPQLDVRYGGIDIEFLGPRLVLQNVIIVRPPDPPEVSIARIVIHDIDPRKPTRPRYLDIELNRLAIGLDVIETNTATAPLSKLGYEEITADARLRYRWEERSGTLAIDELTLKVPNALNLSVWGRIRGISTAAVRKIDLATITLDDLRVAVDDLGLFSRFVKKLHTDEPDLATLTVRGLGEHAAEVPATQRPLFTALHTFFDAPGSFKAKLKTRHPIALAELGEEHLLSAVLERFDIDVEVTASAKHLIDPGRASRTVDILDPVLNYHPEGTTHVYTRDGQLLGKIGRERRFPVALSALPPHLVKAFLAAEDSAFYEHEGLDPTAIFRAVLRNASAGGVVQGGSAITQQVVKQLVVGPERSLGRKLAEAILALRLEKRLSKDEILQVYLNQIYLGAGAYGIEAAARTYFGKSATSLDVAESALVAGLPRAPSSNNPFRSPAAAESRLRYVLDRMLALGWIGGDEHAHARERQLVYEREPEVVTMPEVGAWYLDEVRRQLANTTQVDLSLGLEVRTSLDLFHQQAAETAIRDGLDEASELLGLPVELLQAALVAIEPETGDVVALVGGRDFLDSQYNRATQARRQAGSAFKPFVMSAALDAGFTAASILDDAPKTFVDRTTGVVWEPSNFADRYYGKVSLRTALVKSLNLATVRLAESVGPEKVRDRVKAMGLDTEVPPYLSISLGSAEVSLLGLCRAYTPFARSGSWVEPRVITSIRDLSGKVIVDRPTRTGEAISTQNAFVINTLLQQVIQSGTATVCAALGRPAAGKTGTSNDNRDAWFIGYTPYLLTGVWLGLDDATSMGDPAVGGRVAAPIWLRYRQAVEHLYPVEGFPKPSGVVIKHVSAAEIGATGEGDASYDLPLIEATANSETADVPR